MVDGKSSQAALGQKVSALATMFAIIPPAVCQAESNSWCWLGWM